ncbi:MAG: FAD-binding protein [Planctomycetota bacterium]|nr:MAG: FAD-binding protein [Planctomycetota bacterium]
MTATWTNWSGSVECRPAQQLEPASEEEVADAVRSAARENRTVRVWGSGHSFVPLCASDDVLVSLDRVAGIESVDAEQGEATILAGSKLHDLGEPLARHGLALENQGDVDVQSLAGAVSTGTHGTGRALGSLSTQVVALRMITGNGTLLEVTPADDDLLAASRVSLGALGVLTAIRLRLVPAYRLHERVWQEPIDTCLSRLDERIAATRHYEFFWYPRTGLAHGKALEPTDAAPDDMRGVEGERIDHSYNVFPTVRENRFNEMEYALPADEGPECFAAIRELMRTRHADVTWPVEYRTVAADGIDLSPACGRPTVAISIHQAAQLEHRAFFADAEPIFLAHGGRPHWGKMHSLRAPDLARLYPRWDHFCRVRDRLDPGGTFLNKHLRGLFVNRG